MTTSEIVEQLRGLAKWSEDQTDKDFLESVVTEIARLEEQVKAKQQAYEELADNLGASLSSAKGRIAAMEAALRGVIRVADRKTVEFDAARVALFLLTQGPLP